jgi:endo-1,4-beta-xylanase
MEQCLLLQPLAIESLGETATQENCMRNCLLVGLVVLGGACASSEENPFIQSEEVTSVEAPLRTVATLRSAGATSGRRVGAAVDLEALRADTVYASVLAREFSALTPENEMKWGLLQSAPGVWNFSRADELVRFAQKNRLAVRGHVLVWHLQLPSFVNETLSADELKRAMASHIEATASHFAGKLYAWDVVNEAIDDVGGRMRNSLLFRKMGETFIDTAFHAARAHDPRAKLYYNDYDIEIQNQKSDAVYALVKRLKDRGVPVDGVGFQFHLEARNPPSVDDMVANFNRFTALGVTVNISELDVRLNGVVGTQAQKLALQGRIFQRVAAACRRVQKCYGITSWGFTDKYSWIDSFYGSDDPLQFDEAFVKKPAYEGQRLGLLGQVPVDEPIGAELLPNGSFENGLTGWVGSGAPLSIVTGGRQSASAAAVSARTETYHGILGAIVSPSASKTYLASVWATASAGQQLVFTAKITCEDGTESYVRIASATANGDWVRLRGEFQTPACALRSVEAFAEGPAPGFDLVVDDASVREKLPLP